MLNGNVVAAPDGVRGVDVNARVSPAAATALRQHGYGFVIRYIRRFQSNSYDLTSGEASTILSSGLALGIVQHVESEKSWVPSAVKGISFGHVAGQEAQKIGLPPLTQIWCDLEGVAQGTDHKAVIDYCKWWYDGVAKLGFVPGLYVGWHCGLTADELYHALPFSRYWRAFNLNDDEVPVIRGTCLRQHVATPADIPPGVELELDTDTTNTDAKGGLSTFIGPPGWLASFTG